jgi:hypothetical protein
MVDWEQAQWQEDGLDMLQAAKNVELQAASDGQQAALDAAAAPVGTVRDFRKGTERPKDLAQAGHAVRLPLRRHEPMPCMNVASGAFPDSTPCTFLLQLQPDDHVGKTSELLSACPPGEVALLQGLGGYRKLIMTWRAIRAQQFVAFTRLDLEQRRAKAAALERQVYPDHTRVLSKEEYEAFFDRLMADTARRAQHRDELAEKAREEALAKLKKTAPPPPTHKRQQADASPSPVDS